MFTVESDKATLEVESPAKGYLRKILTPAGEEQPVLTPVALITKTLDEDISGYEAEALAVTVEKAATAETAIAVETAVSVTAAA